MWQPRAAGFTMSFREFHAFFAVAFGRKQWREACLVPRQTPRISPMASDRGPGSSPQGWPLCSPLAAQALQSVSARQYKSACFWRMWGHGVGATLGPRNGLRTHRCSLGRRSRSGHVVAFPGDPVLSMDLGSRNVGLRTSPDRRWSEEGSLGRPRKPYLSLEVPRKLCSAVDGYG